MRFIKLMSRTQVRVFKLDPRSRGQQVADRCRLEEAGADAAARPTSAGSPASSSRRRCSTSTTDLTSSSSRSQGGLPKNPQWYANLLAHPDTTVSLKGERDRPVRARTATADERAALWPRLVELYADFAKYQKWTDREIPVVVLEPR